MIGIMHRTLLLFFLGVPCTGGDYNDGYVSCRKANIDATREAVCRIAEGYPAFCEKEGLPLR
jgi:hypothetical protein